MYILKKLFGKKVDDKITPPKGVCPNCWGRQEYQGQIYEAIKKENLYVKSIDDKKGWIRAYAMENFPKIWLVEKEGVAHCETCQMDYKKIES